MVEAEAKADLTGFTTVRLRLLLRLCFRYARTLSCDPCLCLCLRFSVIVAAVLFLASSVRDVSNGWSRSTGFGVFLEGCARDFLCGFRDLPARIVWTLFRLLVFGDALRAFCKPGGQAMRRVLRAVRLILDEFMCRSGPE